MSIIIDNREHDLKTALDALECVCTVNQLHVGDIHVCSDDGSIRAIIERKTCADMAASRKDGRWDEQKLRLLQERINSNAHIIYIIEGSWSFKEDGYTHGLPNKSLVSMYLNSTFKNDIKVIVTKNVADTAKCIRAIATRMCNYPVFSPSINTNAPTQEQHQETLIKSQKKKNVTSNTVLLAQLAAIPGISITKARSLVDGLKLTCMKDIFSLLEGKSDAEAFKCLQAIEGIGPKIAKELLEKLTSPSNT